MRILFELQHLYYLAQFESVICKLRDYYNYDLFISLNLSVPKIEKDLFYREVIRLKIETIKANFEPQRKRILKEMKFDLIFVGNKSSILDIKAKNSFVVMIYHGIGIKSSYYNDLTKNMDLICVESVNRETILKKMSFHAVNTGFPKFDLLKNKKPKIKNEYLLYAPTFFPSSLQKTIPYLRKINHFNVLIKLHHFFWTKKKYIIHKSALEYEIKKLKNIKIVPFECHNILDLFHQSSVMITDFSSAIFEYLVMDNPIIQTNYYSLSLKYRLFPALFKRRMDHERQKQIDFSIICREPQELNVVIEKALCNTKKLSKKRKSAKKKFLGKVDFKCADRILEAITHSGISIGA
tara:strand:- start:2719 stop:3771 length:1053 start_codon:yes stop_codon:yes gene_type:complete